MRMLERAKMLLKFLDMKNFSILCKILHEILGLLLDLAILFSHIQLIYFKFKLLKVKGTILKDDRCIGIYEHHVPEICKIIF